jgi:pimeloyl-[acyl-carrier protein] methyl ester esterase
MSLHIDSTGSGPDLLLLHGWAMHSGIFKPLLPWLSAHFRVHCLDLPGHGRSLQTDVPLDYEAVWQALLPRLAQPALVMGWSLGGLFTLYGGIHHAKACRGLILQNASPCFVGRPDWPMGMPASVFQQFAAELNRDYRQTLHRFFMLEAQGAEKVRDDLRCLQQTAFEFGQPSIAVLQQGLQLLESTDVRGLLPGLKVPSLWLAGRRDRLVSAHAMQAAANLANGQFLCDERGGHAPFLSHPEAIANAIMQFNRALA